jgi:hypothetical protein
MANFLIGFPGENEKDFQETMDFVQAHKGQIDSMMTNLFRLEDSPVKRYPDKYGIRLLRDFEINNRANTKTAEYEEIGGIPYENMAETHHKRFLRLIGLFNDDGYKLGVYPNKMLFPLYDHLKEKDKVTSFYREHFSKIDRLIKVSNSVFVGSQSNQRAPGNLHECSIEMFRKVPRKAISSNLGELKSKGFKNLIVFGGEPLIRSDARDILAEAKGHGFEKIYLKTNARMLSYPDFCSEVAKYVDDILCISPSDEETEYDRISGVRGSFRQAQKGIDNWKNRRAKI